MSKPDQDAADHGIGACRLGPGLAQIVAEASPPRRRHVMGIGTTFTKTFKVGDWFTLDPDGVHHTSKIESISSDGLLLLVDPYLAAAGTEDLPYAKGKCPI